MRLGLFFKGFGNDHVSRDRPRAGWTRVVTSRRSETDHYNYTHFLTILSHILNSFLNCC